MSTLRFSLCAERSKPLAPGRDAPIVVTGTGLNQCRINQFELPARRSARAFAGSAGERPPPGQ